MCIVCVPIELMCLSIAESVCPCIALCMDLSYSRSFADGNPSGDIYVLLVAPGTAAPIVRVAIFTSQHARTDATAVALSAPPQVCIFGGYARTFRHTNTHKHTLHTHTHTYNTYTHEQHIHSTHTHTRDLS